jgi:hypothetical protein
MESHSSRSSSGCLWRVRLGTRARVERLFITIIGLKVYKKVRKYSVRASSARLCPYGILVSFTFL